MKKLLTAAALLTVAMGAFQLPALAADAWFDKYDHDHDGRWKYNDFVRAHHDWAKRHHDDKVITDRELKTRWHDLDKEHHGWVKADDVREFHHWD